MEPTAVRETYADPAGPVARQEPERALGRPGHALPDERKVPAADGFWIFGDRLALTEDWHAELWLDDTHTIATYQRVWLKPRESAVFGARAQRLIVQARRGLALP